MSNYHLNRAWCVEDLSGTEKLVLVRLADRADRDGLCYPGQTSVAKECCLTPRTVRDALHSLVSKGHLEIAVPPTFSSPATYRVTPRPPEGDSGGESSSTGETGSVPSGKALRSPPEAGSGPLRKELPPNPQLTLIEPTITPTPPSAPVDRFYEFWTLYPKRKAKVAAQKAWKKIKASEVDAILADVSARKAGEEWTKCRGQYVPKPTKYLNERWWEDEGPEPVGTDFRKTPLSAAERKAENDRILRESL